MKSFLKGGLDALCFVTHGELIIESVLIIENVLILGKKMKPFLNVCIIPPCPTFIL